MGLKVLRDRLALVPQDTTLFLGTLRENLYAFENSLLNFQILIPLNFQGSPAPPHGR